MALEAPGTRSASDYFLGMLWRRWGVIVTDRWQQHESPTL